MNLRGRIKVVLAAVALLLVAVASVRAQEAEAKPAVDERLERILERVGESVTRYQAELFRIAFTETLRHEELREDMTPKKSKEFVFDTIVAREALSADEDDYYPKTVRRLRSIDGKPAQRAKGRDATAGAAVSSLIFLLPKHRKEFQFSLEGEEKLEGRRVFRIRMLQPGEGPPRVEWKGRLVGVGFYVFAPTVSLLWVDAETYDVLRFESHLTEPFEFESPHSFSAGPLGRFGPSRRLRYAARDYVVNFRRERFKDPELTLLVPVTAEWVNIIEGASKPRTRATLRFSNYQRFRSDVKVIEEEPVQNPTR
ncbi:MAG: hypothetical protein QOH49_4431 [Acidobacteriota bacterium]|jgi:hypothetical protein|nr:hypothetical protein [Acidobacteriota bacterium]